MKSTLILSSLLAIILSAGSVIAAETPAETTKASKIIVPRLNFRQATVDEGLSFLLKKSRELDPDKSGVPIILVASEKGKETKFDLDLVNVSIADAIKYLAIAAGLEMTRDGEAFVLKSK